MSQCIVCQAAASVYCENDQAFLCPECDHKIHSSNLVASRHVRVRVCELCHKVAATVYCKNDRAFLCAGCDTEIHSNNPLASRHDIVPASEAGVEGGCCGVPVAIKKELVNAAPSQSIAFSETSAASSVDRASEHGSKLVSSVTIPVVPSLSEDVGGPGAEAAPQADGGKQKDMELFELDSSWLDRLEVGFDFSDILAEHASEGMVPGQAEGFGDNAVPCMSFGDSVAQYNPSALSGPLDCYVPSLPANYSAESALTAGNVSALAAGGVLPSGTLQANFQVPPCTLHVGAQPLLDRHARVERYREKRKNRKFEKTIRYASRKAYAEVRPRIKGRFAKKEEVQAWKAAEAAMKCKHTSASSFPDPLEMFLVPSFPC